MGVVTYPIMGRVGSEMLQVLDAKYFKNNITQHIFAATPLRTGPCSLTQSDVCRHTTHLVKHSDQSKT